MHSDTRHNFKNIDPATRWALAIGGGALTVLGVQRRSPAGLLLTLVGAGCLYEAITGHCELYHALKINRAERPEDEVPVAREVHVQEMVLINKPADELYQFWRRFENLPRFLTHLDSVTEVGENQWHWVAKGPVGFRVEWDAEIYNEKENELIAWRALPGSEFVNAGTVRFEPASDPTSTIVRVIMNYNVPGGQLTAALAHLMRQAPEQFLKDDLYRLKQLLETGEIVFDENDLSGYLELPEPSSSRGRGGTLMGRAHPLVE